MFKNKEICIMGVADGDAAIYNEGMKSVMEYQDYRAYLGEAYAERKARTGFTWREFARLAGYASPVFLKLVCEGKSSLSELGVERVASALGLAGKELAYFRALVAFNQAKDSASKSAHLSQMRSIAQSCAVKVLGSDQYDYFADWYNPVLRELAPQLENPAPEALSALLKPAVSASKVRRALDLLQECGLLAREENGRLRQTDASVSTGSEVVSLAVRGMHRQMGSLAVEALENVPREERDFSGLTLGLSAEGFAQAREELEACRRRLVEIARVDSATHKVYRLNLQLFPLTQSIGEGA